MMRKKIKDIIYAAGIIFFAALLILQIYLDTQR
jgi:hypothetical protein